MSRHFLHIPGPTYCPDDVLRAVSAPPIDHRGPKFKRLANSILNGIRPIFGTNDPVVIYASSGTGALEAALVNTLSPGDKVLFLDAGHFANNWRQMADDLGLDVNVVSGDWRKGVDVEVVGEKLAGDTAHEIQAVCCVHNETSTGVVTPIEDIRMVMDAHDHPALLLVDAISSLGAMDYRHSEWGVDVTIAGSQKGLMLPPGLGFNAVSNKALKAHESSRFAKSYWRWETILTANVDGFWPRTPPTNLLYGLEVSINRLGEEGMSTVFARHQRHAAATRAAIRGWGLEVYCLNDSRHSGTLTAVQLPAGHSAHRVREIALGQYDISLGTGLGQLADHAFRIAHLGDLNDLTLVGALGGVQMSLQLAGLTIDPGGLTAAARLLEGSAGLEQT